QMGPITTTVAYSATGSLSQHSDMIVLGSMALPAPGMDAATFGPQAAKALHADFGATIKDSHAQKICNHTQAGWYISSQLTIDGSDMDVEETFAIGKTRAQMASYVREKDTAEITNARKSLDTLCLQ
ncbi:MAG: hypothetical protein M3Y18_09250, partial [Candidatus Eremiobacteraeota bacterium]|nr:hypothetical protein [Candidatus Eremiobacteraeota bacterium]